MIRGVIASLVIGGFLATGWAQAESTAEALQTFGLVGTWSPDCLKDPMKEPGFRVTYKASTFGSPTYTVVFSGPNIGAQEFKWKIQSAERVTEDKLRMTAIVVSAKEIVPPFRTISTANYKPDNSVIVKQGKKIQVGNPANVYEKCLN